jgi:SAM-dependent methyltransferase
MRQQDPSSPAAGHTAPSLGAPSASALSFGADSAGYHAVRPGYPSAAVDWALPGQPERVLDLGAGTGILTRSLQQRQLAVVAADPSLSMLRTLAQDLPATSAVVATAEAIALRTATVDAVVVGAAFHWFSRPAADAEIGRVLRPGGSAALLWNPVDPAHPLGEIFRQARRSLGLDANEYDPGVELDPRWFGPTERRTFPAEASMTVDAFLAQLSSRSYMLTAAPGDRERILTRARETASQHAAPAPGPAAAGPAGDRRVSVPLAVTVLRAGRAPGR